MNGKFVINRQDAKIMGVGAGIAQWLGVDALPVRLALVLAAILFPVTILFYILTGWLASDR